MSINSVRTLTKTMIANGLAHMLRANLAEYAELDPKLQLLINKCIPHNLVTILTPIGEWEDCVSVKNNSICRIQYVPARNLAKILFPNNQGDIHDNVT